MRKRGLLWKINVDSKSAPGYLFGTMHSAGSIATDKVSQVFPFIRECTGYFGESDIDQLLTKPFQTASAVWEGLRQLLSPPSYAKSRHQLWQRYKLELDDIQHLPPMLLSTLIGEKMLSAPTREALDIQLWNLAKNHGLDVKGLESVEEQEKIYAGIPLTYQIRQLKKMILNLSGSCKSLLRIEDAYFRDDLTALYRLTHKHLGKTKKIILYDRNRIMAQRIGTLLHDTSSAIFFAIGAAHLPGQKGVLRLLKQSGYGLKPILLE